MEIKIDGEIGYWGVTAESIQSKLNSATGDISVIIDSPGGDVFEGVKIYNALNKYDKGGVTVRINSLAASIASYIAMAGDTIETMSNATFMIHNVWTVAVGDHRELRAAAYVAEGLTGLIASAYAARTGRSKEDVLKLMADETYFFGEDIKEGGFADEMIDADNTPKKEALAMAKERFKACSRSVKEHTEEPPLEQMAALLPNKEDEPAKVISGEMVAKRFKLITGEEV